MSINASIATSLLPQPITNGFDFSIFAQGGSGSAVPAYNPGTINLALENAEKNKTKQLEQAASSATVQADLARYEDVVSNAKTLDEVLDDPIARKVLLKANGLGDQVNNIGLAKKALVSNPDDADSLANKLSSINGNWLDFTKLYGLDLLGVEGLQGEVTLNQVKDAYIEEVRLDTLDEQLPGLGTAILFKRIAASFESSLQILGDDMAREVITTTFGIPKEIAIQSLEAQQLAIESRLDISKLQNPDFVERLVHRYLLATNSEEGGITA